MTTQDFGKFVNINKYHVMQQAAYISRQTLRDELTGKLCRPHAATKDRLCGNILLPEGAPEEYKDVKTLWDAVNRTGYDRVAKAWRMGLPYEATDEQRIEMVERYLNDTFVRLGYIVQYEIHNEKIKNGINGNHNFHVHVLMTDMPCIGGELIQAREANGKSKTLYVDDEGKIIQKIASPKLKKKKLQYDKDGNIITEPGYKKLVTDKNGKPLLDKNGYPVLEDIRVIDGTSQNGKYKKTKYKRTTIKTLDFDKNGGYHKLRKLWEKYHNDVVKEYDIRTKDGQLAIINLDSYAVQDAHLPEELRRVPQKKVYDENKKKNLQTIEDNKRIAKHNEQVMAIRTAEKEQLEMGKAVLEIQQNALEQKRQAEMLHPEKTWTDTWVSESEKLKNETTRVFAGITHVIKQTMEAGAKKYHELPETPENTIERNRIARQWKLMQTLKDKIPGSLTNMNNIKQYAEQAWEKLPDQLKVAFVKEQYGLEQSIIYAQVLAREKRDLNIIDGLEKECPFIPNNKSTQVAIRKATKSICGTVNIKSYEAAAYEKWDTGTYQAPPQELINLLNTYATLDKYYLSKLTNKKWTKQNVIAVVQYDPAGIEAKAQTEMNSLRAKQTRQAESEKQAKEKAAAERAAAEKAEYRRMYVQINWQKLVPHYQLAVKNNDRDTVFKISALVKDAFGEKTVQTKYNRACQDRDQEHENMLHRYAELHRQEELDRMEKLPVNQGRYITDRDAELSLENQFVTKNNKINARKLNAAVQEHNQNVKLESDVIETKKYQKYADEANFWYSMLHPEQAIRQPKEVHTKMLNKGKPVPEIPVEIQMAPDTKQNRAPAAKQTTVPGTVSQTTGKGINLLPNATGKDANLKVAWKEDGPEHDKSTMEIIEEETYKNWKPGSENSGKGM